MAPASRLVLCEVVLYWQLVRYSQWSHRVLRGLSIQVLLNGHVQGALRVLGR